MVRTHIFTEDANKHYDRDGEPIYYHGPHELWNIAGGPQKLSNFIFKFYLYLPEKIRRENYVKERDMLLLVYWLRVCLSLSYVLTW